MKYIIGCLLLLSQLASAESGLTITEDDFSNDKVYQIRIETIKNEPAVLFITCEQSNKSLSVQLVVAGTIFPDETRDGFMFANTTHKFVSESEALTTNWVMNLMKYKMMQYTKDEVEFITNAKSAKGVNLRLNKRGDVFKFNFDEVSQHFDTLLTKCS